jgi:hypothetical protein
MKYAFWSVLLLFTSCVSVKELALYENEVIVEETKDVNGFQLTDIFTDDITSEIWFTPSPICLTVTSERKEVFSGTGAMKFTWNKQAGGCPWLGLGIGWANWSGKDLGSIENSAAITFKVKTQEGSMKGLPWAMALEDYAGTQAWIGVTSGYVEGGIVDTTWRTVTIPLVDFQFEGWNLDAGTVKQLLIQFESNGTVFVDEFKIIPFTPKASNTLVVTKSYGWVNDGFIEGGQFVAQANMDGSVIYLNWNEKDLYIGGEIEDVSPCRNMQSGRDIWNGDAIEIAFSSETGISDKRMMFYEGDRHIGIKMGGNFDVYDWSREKNIKAQISVKPLQNKYVFECVIPWTELGVSPWKNNSIYNIELAIDGATTEDTRAFQKRWNSINNENFNTNPSLWGKLKVEIPIITLE